TSTMLPPPDFVLGGAIVTPMGRDRPWAGRGGGWVGGKTAPPPGGGRPKGPLGIQRLARAGTPPKWPPQAIFEHRKTTVVVGPPPDGLGTVKVNSSSPLNDSNRLCIVPSKFGKVLPFIVIVISCVASSTT